MKKILLPFFLFIGINLFAQEKFQLASPLLKFKSVFFKDRTSFEILFNQPGAEIRYTLNGNEPTASDLLYKGPVAITKSTIVNIKAIGKNFQPSETVTAQFIKDGKAIREIYFSTPNEFYAKAKKDVLHDNIGGFTNFSGGTWIGYDKDSVEIDITLNKKQKINSVFIELLQDENSWIFLPEQILMYYFDEKNNAYQPVGKEVFFQEGPSPKQCSIREIVPKHEIKTDKIMLIFQVLKKIPDWHPGKGNHAWLFIDEIKVY